MKYQQFGKRDLRLDLLRGFCLFAMAINHGGLESYFHTITGGATFLINAAEGFFFISGMTLGIISVGKPLADSVERLLKRAWIVYLTVIALSFGFFVLVVLTGVELWDDPFNPIFDDLLEWGVGFVTLRFSYFGSDILIAYVVYLAVAPLALWGLDRKRTGVVIGAMGFVYLLSQLSLELTELPFASFRHLASNNLVFFGGLVIGYHRETLSQFWARFSLARVVDWGVIGLGLLLFYFYTQEFVILPEMAEDLLDFSVREFEMPPLSLAVVFIYIRFFWLVTTYFWSGLSRITSWLLLPLGQASLFTFVMHLCLIPIFWNFPELFEDLDLFTASLWNGALVAVIFLSVKIRAWVLNGPIRDQRAVMMGVQNLPLIFSLVFILVFVSLAFSDGWY